MTDTPNIHFEPKAVVEVVLTTPGPSVYLGGVRFDGSWLRGRELSSRPHEDSEGNKIHLESSAQGDLFINIDHVVRLREITNETWKRTRQKA